MKTVLLTAVLLTSAFAQAALKDIREVLPSGKWVGESMTNYKCSVETKWLSKTELQVKATSKYKDQPANKYETVFSTSKEEDSGYLNPHETAQSTPLHTNEDGLEIKKYETFDVEIEGEDITTLNFQAYQTDGENDPRELFISVCSDLTRVK